MEPLVNAYWTAKFGTTPDEYEDAFAYSSNSRHFAIADGATESSFADRWARALVQKYSKEPPSPTGGKLSLPEWVKPLQKEWHDNIKWDSLPWFAEEKARMGAFATFLGLSFSSHTSKKAGKSLLSRFQRKKETEKMIWRACAIGDSCMFHVRDGALVKAFPLTRSEDFQSRPVLLCSNPENNGSVWKALQLAEGECRHGDVFFALTDALAKWFLAEIEMGNKPWDILNGLRNASAFEDFVGRLRDGKAIRNDDTTMLSLRWSKDNTGGKTTFSSKR